MTRPTILVTGATGTIGGAAALALAERGARVVLLGRDADTLHAKAESIRTVAGDVEVEWERIDFADLESVRTAAESLRDRFETLDGLVLSVGVFKQGGPHLLPDGHELMFATNVLGPFLFTRLLLDVLERSHGTVVHVIATFRATLDWEDLESLRRHRAMKAFDRTKLCNRLFAGELARRYEGRVTSIAFDPTFVSDPSDDALKQRWPTGLTGLLWRVYARLRAQPPEVAGVPLAELMLSPDVRELNGAWMVLDEKADRPGPDMQDEEAGAELWRRLDRLAGLADD